VKAADEQLAKGDHAIQQLRVELAAEREAGQAVIKIHREAVDIANQLRKQLADERKEKI
jgi:hypothetical protein